jgi:hypothetical protein
MVRFLRRVIDISFEFLGYVRQGSPASKWPQLRQLESTLGRHIVWMHLQGGAVLLLTGYIAFHVYFDIKGATEGQVQFIERARNQNQVVAYLVVRGSALAALATAGLIMGVKLTIASYDQATRFTKRRMAAMFLEHLYDNHKDDIAKPITLLQLMASFDMWNKTVESAFSQAHPKENDGMLADLTRRLADKALGDNEKEEKAVA